MSTMRSLEIFSGVGGLAKGLEASGFTHAAFVEFNRHASLSLCSNFDPKSVFFGDIRDFDLSSIGAVDLVAGGPPCQPFSLGGKHRAHNDARDMFPYAIRAIEELRPQAFVFENVKGLLRSSFSDYFEYIISRLSFPSAGAAMEEDWRSHLARLRQLRCGRRNVPEYRVAYALINAADFGVPQIRERVFIVGTRSDLNVSYSFPPTTHSEDRLLWEMAVTKEYWRRHRLQASEGMQGLPDVDEIAGRIKQKYGFFEPDHRAWRTVRDALSDVPDPRGNHGIIDHIFRDGARSYAGHTGSDLDWPAKTIKAGGHGVPGGENMIRYLDGSVRYLTVFEAKRIQAFPDDFVIKGAWGEAMRQIGNAVPVALAEIIGRSIMQALKSLKENLVVSGPCRVSGTSLAV